MSLFSKKLKRIKFLHKFNQTELISFIKEILTAESSFTIKKHSSEAYFLFSCNHFEVQHEILKWLNDPRRAAIRDNYLFCSCGPSTMDVNCPIHGITAMERDKL